MNLNNSILISKLIDGKFPNYVQVIPKNNQKKIEVDLKLFLDSVDRVASVSLDKKDGVKFNLAKDVLIYLLIILLVEMVKKV